MEWALSTNTRGKKENLKLQTELMPISNCKYFSVYFANRMPIETALLTMTNNSIFNGKMLNCNKCEFNFGICSLKLNTRRALPSMNQSIQFWDYFDSISTIITWIRTNSIINWKTFSIVDRLGKNCFEVARIADQLSTEYREMHTECRCRKVSGSMILNLLFECQGLHVTSCSMLNCYYYYNFGHSNVSKFMEKMLTSFVMYWNSFDTIYNIFFQFLEPHGL